MEYTRLHIMPNHYILIGTKLDEGAFAGPSDAHYCEVHILNLGVLAILSTTTALNN